ncbi:MAG: proprotein convertase P-domain-containing protein [Pirellulaceae bacterium]
MHKTRNTVLPILVGLFVLPAFLTADIVKSGLGGNIPDNNAGGVSFSAEVAEDEMVEGVLLQLNGFNHTWVGDLVITLTGPDGSVATIMNRTGTGFLNDSSNLTAFTQSGPPSAYIFDDDATGDWWAEAALGGTNYEMRPGPYRPSDDSGLFASMNAQFANKSSQGTWTLTVSDNLGGDTGALETWDLTLITSEVVPEPGTTLLLASCVGCLVLVRRKRRTIVDYQRHDTF